MLDSDIMISSNFTPKSYKLVYNKRNNTIDNSEHWCFTIVQKHRFDTFIKKVINIISKEKTKNSLAKQDQFYQDGININLLRRRSSIREPEYDGPLFLGKVWVDHLIALGMPSENAHEHVSNAVKDIVNILQTNRVK